MATPIGNINPNLSSLNLSSASDCVAPALRQSSTSLITQCSCFSGSQLSSSGAFAKQGSMGNLLFNLKSFNSLKKDQTNIKIFKNSSFDSSFNSVQSLNTNLSLSNTCHKGECYCLSLPCLKGRQAAKAGSVQKRAVLLQSRDTKNILFRNMKYNFLKSTLSSILNKKIRSISEVLEDKPIKNYILYSYLKNYIFSSTASDTSNGISATAIPFAIPSANQSKALVPLLCKCTKLSLNKYKGRKLGSLFNYNKIISYKFNSTLYQAPIASASILKASPNSTPTLSDKEMHCYAGHSNTVPPLIGSAPRWQLSGVECGNIYIKDTYKLLFYLFKSMYCLISKPVLKYTNDKVTIQLFYYLNIPKKKVFRLFSISYINSIKKKWLALLGSSYSSSALLGRRGNTKIYIRWRLRKTISRFKNKNIKNLLFKLIKFNLTFKAVYQNKFKLICAILSNKLNKPVELQLIRLHHPYHDSNILVNLLSLNIKNKKKKARIAIQKIYNKKPVKILNDYNLNNHSVSDRGTGKLIPAYLSGLNIKIAGRLMGEPIIPRITTKIFGNGASAIGKVNYLDVARITKKNRKGAYTIKITSGQNFF